MLMKRALSLYHQPKSGQAASTQLFSAGMVMGLMSPLRAVSTAGGQEYQW